MRVVVIGAGVGGLALARGLVAAGHRVTVYEQADGLRTDGGSVTLWSGSTAILRGLGADPLPLGRRIDALEARAAEGGTLFTVDLTRAAAAFGAPAVHVLRQSLVEALAAGLPEGTVRYGRRCVRAAGGGLVEFQDGSAADGDVVVGADGRRSVVRKHALGGDPARPTAWITWQGVAELPAGLAAGTRGVLISGREGLCGLMPAGAGRLLWWFDERAEEGERGRRAGWRTHLTERFGGWAAPVPEVLKAAADGPEPDYFPHYRQRVPRVWGRGPVTLMGDAAHSMPPTMAQGANQAIEDAWALTRVLAAVPEGVDVAGRLRAYERARARRARSAARVSGTEGIDRYAPPRLLRAVPDAVIARAYAAWTRHVSTYLSARHRKMRL